MLSRIQPVVVSTPGHIHPVDTFTARTGSKYQLKPLNELLKIDLLESHEDYHLKAGYFVSRLALPKMYKYHLQILC
jgi:hypothetical protein